MSRGPLFTIAQVAQHLGVSLSTVYNEVNQGRLAQTMIRGCKRVAQEDLHAYIAGNRQQLSPYGLPVRVAAPAAPAAAALDPDRWRARQAERLANAPRRRRSAQPQS